MSQTPDPRDPLGAEPGDPSSVPGEDRPSPTSDPALHPHDPYATSAPAAPAEAPDGQAQPGSPAPSPLGSASGPTSASEQSSQQDPYAPQSQHPSADHYAQQGAPQYAQQGVPQHAQQGAPQAGYAAPPRLDGPPPGTKGVYEGPLSGQPTSDADSRLWGMFAQLSVALGHLVSSGFLGWVGPLIIFLVYKDRDRFVRFHAAEALNGAITVLIAQFALGIVLGLFTLVTLGLGAPALALVPIPALLQFIFSIVAAVKANQGQWWGYPLNIRLVK